MSSDFHQDLVCTYAKGNQCAVGVVCVSNIICSVGTCSGRYDSVLTFPSDHTALISVFDRRQPNHLRLREI
jgi:hypothetical protein